MTDRIHSLTVVLERDMRDDDVECVVKAIEMVRCVQKVTPHISDIDSHMAESRAQSDFDDMLCNVLRVSRDPRRKKLMAFLKQLVEEPRG